MSSVATLVVRIVTETESATKGFDETTSRADKMKAGLKVAGVAAAAAAVGVLALGKHAISAASDLQQASGAVEAVFGRQAEVVKRNSEAAAKTMGLSASQYQNYAALVGTALQNAGMSVSDSVTASNKVMQRGADLSALYGGTTAEAVEAINAAVSRSEFDPLEKYGVSLNMTAVNAELAAKGQDKLTGAALETAKKQQILQDVFAKSAKAQGQYARESDSAAGAQQTATAEWENASAALGTALLPLVSKLASAFAKFAGLMARHTTTFQILAGVILAIAAALVIMNLALTVTAALTAPITLIILAVVAAVAILVTVVILAVKHFDDLVAIADKVGAAIKGAISKAATVVVAAANRIKNAFSAVLGWVRSNWPKILAILTGPIGVAVLLIVKNWDKIKGAVTSAIGKVQDFVNWIGRIKIPDAIKNAWDKIKTAVGDAVQKVRDLIHWIGQVVIPAGLSGPFDTLKTAVNGVISAVKSLIGWLGKIHVPKISLPGNPFGRSAAAAASVPTVAGLAASPRVATTAPRATSNAGGGINIVVNGAIDPEATARQIQRILSGHGRRIGVTV